MSDAFWGGVFVAIPAILASIMAYWKSEKAEARALIAQQLAGVCRFIPCANQQLLTSPADDKTQGVEEMRKRLSLLEESAKSYVKMPIEEQR